MQRPQSVQVLDRNDTMSIIRQGEWRFLFGGALFLYIFVCTYMSGWKVSFLPNLTAPYGYDGDLVFHSWMIRRVMEGWLFENPRSGYPFGSTFLDYPGSDFGNHLLLKLFGLLGGSVSAAINLYFVAGFVTTYIASYLVLRTFSLSNWLSLAGAIVFTISPYHFLRLPHLFYTWYFVIPIYYFIGLYFLFLHRKKLSIFKFSVISVTLLISASFGAYYALFGSIVIFVCGIAGSISIRQWRPLLTASAFTFIILLGVLINISPNILYRTTNGANPEVAQRSPVEAELYGLKFIQLILPQQGHVNNKLSRFSAQYDAAFPLVNENRYASLGVIGSIGLLTLTALIAVSLSGRRIDLHLSGLTLIVATLFMFGTIGGFGTVFALLISPMIRGWNRISVFIAFGSVACFMIVLQHAINSIVIRFSAKHATVVASIGIIGLALFDQLPVKTRADVENTRATFLADHAFVAAIEAILPTRSPIYQLPYTQFPEFPPLGRMGAYSPLVGYLHSDALLWSAGGMKGRPGDLFFRALSKETTQKQLAVIGRLGFAGIYVDKRGYEDNGKQILGELANALGHGPDLIKADGDIVFFKLPSANPVELDGMTTLEIMKKAGYIADEAGVRYDAKLIDGIDFTKPGFPSFVTTVRGLSYAEPWGRWSDQNLAPTVRFEFDDDLPHNFDLLIDLTVFGPNAGAPMVVKVGTRQYEVTLPANSAVLRIPVEGGTKVRSLEFIPPHPASPTSTISGSDNRKLGVGFRKIGFDY